MLPSMTYNTWFFFQSVKIRTRCAKVTPGNLMTLKCEHELGQQLTLWQSGSLDCGGHRRHFQLCGPSICLFLGGVYSLCSPGRSAVTVGGFAVLNLHCGESLGPCACFCLRGCCFCRNDHLSWRPLRLDWWECCRGLQGRGGGCGGRWSRWDSGLCNGFCSITTRAAAQRWCWCCW